MTANELLPCPFCGGQVEITSRDGETPWDEIGVIYCPGCNSKYENTMDFQNPASTWNRRAPLTRAALAASPLVQEIVAEAVKAEREACARVCETLGALGGVTPNPRAEWKTHADNLAAAIRARGEGQPQEKGE